MSVDPAHAKPRKAVQQEMVMEKRPGDKEHDGKEHDRALDKQLEDSMDASDPPSKTKPGDDGGPVPSSGYKGDD